eukprot:COSAG06_NODE_14313_length_1167_cov_6.308052_3_plen_118_part_00
MALRYIIRWWRTVSPQLQTEVVLRRRVWTPAGHGAKWDERHNRLVRDGSMWVEKEIDKLPEGSYRGLWREQVLWWLEQYMKQSLSKRDALTRLRDSLRSDSGPTNDSSKLAILSKED